MKMKNALGTLSLAAALVFAPLASAGVPGTTIEGNYLEVRSCDVWTGPCFANGEVGLTGEEATMVWDVTKGAWNGVPLAGMRVIAVVRANATLTDTAQQAYTGKSVIVVDEKATEAQRDALVDLAREMSGSLSQEVVEVKAAPIEVTLADADEEAHARVSAGDTIAIETRALHEHDKHCGNERAYYPPLTNVDDAMAMFTKRDKFLGGGLGVTWDDSGRRSAYLAKFSR